MSDLIERAISFAVQAHRGQTRYNKAKTPLVTHITEVALLVERSGGSEIEIAAAWLHDTVEDTDTILEDIRREFGDEMAEIVDGFTDPLEFSKLHTPERKLAQAGRVSTESDSVKRVKMADQVSNTRSVATDPPIHWDSQKCLEYAHGAREIIERCYGISSFLEEEFFRAYDDAILAHAG